jgi:hypothetical protein
MERYRFSCSGHGVSHRTVAEKVKLMWKLKNGGGWCGEGTGRAAGGQDSMTEKGA